MNFNFFNLFSKNQSNGESSGGAANIDPDSLEAADFAGDEDFFLDIESWGERIAIK